jgi:hypothetical protein
MAEQALLTVPDLYVPRFRAEALDRFAAAAQAIEEVGAWTREDRERGLEPRARVDQDKLDSLHEGERLFVQAAGWGGGDLRVEARSEVLLEAVAGCSIEAADDLREALGQPDWHALASLRLDEVRFWQTERGRLVVSD